MKKRRDVKRRRKGNKEIAGECSFYNFSGYVDNICYLQSFECGIEEKKEEEKQKEGQVSRAH